MKYKRGMIVGLLLAVMLLCACGQPSSATELSKSLDSGDGLFTLSTPDSWDYYDALYAEDMAMAVWNNDTAYASVFFFSNEFYDDNLETWVSEVEALYADDIIGSTEQTTINGMDAYFFQYSTDDYSEYDEKYNYQGYEYWISTSIGIVNIDINYAQTLLEDIVFDPSEDELKVLQTVAESFLVK